MNHTQDEHLDALTRASVVEMLNEMAMTLAQLRGCTYLSRAQSAHVESALCHIDKAVTEWVGEVAGDLPPSSRKERVIASTPPEQPARGLAYVLDMLAIYHDALDERDFTPIQYQRITIAMHNLLAVVRELMKNVH